MVDIVHHAIVGAAGAVAASSLGHPDFGAAFLVASLVPDLDVLFVALGKSRFLRLHQGATHSLVGIGALSVLGGLAISAATGAGAWAAILGFLAGMSLHVALDLLNTFGVMLLWPFCSRRFSADAFFFIDVWMLLSSLLTLAGLLAGCPPAAAVVGWATFLVAYSALRTVGRLAIRKRLGTETEIPSGVHPLRWFVTRSGVDDSSVGGPCIWAGTVDLPFFRETSKQWFRKPSAELLRELRTGPLYTNLEASLRRLTPVKIERTSSWSIVVVSRCVAVPNFGNRYGETVSEIDRGKVVNENARI